MVDFVAPDILLENEELYKPASYIAKYSYRQFGRSSSRRYDNSRSARCARAGALMAIVRSKIWKPRQGELQKIPQVSVSSDQRMEDYAF
jgi:hypothetical protein